MTPLQSAVSDLVQHNLTEPDPKEDFDGWVQWSMKQTELISKVCEEQKQSRSSPDDVWGWNN